MHAIGTAAYHLQHFVRRAAASLSEGAIVLDAGAGDSPYRALFSHVRYEAADICQRDAHHYAHVDYACDLTAIPVEDMRYDLVLCTQVLEHVRSPLEVLRELRRVLKPGGRVWMSAPLSYEEHEVPYDFFRFTRFGWEHLLSESGLELLELGWVQGFLGTLAYQANYARHHLPLHPSHYGGGLPGLVGSAVALVAKPVLLGFAVAWSQLDRRFRCVTAGYPLDYCVVAQRPQ